MASACGSDVLAAVVYTRLVGDGPGFSISARWAPKGCDHGVNRELSGGSSAVLDLNVFGKGHHR